MPDVQGRCPACDGASLFLGEGGHVTCSRIDCAAPDAADQLLHGEEEGVLQLFRGDFGTRLILRALEADEPSSKEAQLAGGAAWLAHVAEGQAQPFRAAFSSLLPPTPKAPGQPLEEDSRAPCCAGDVLAALGHRIPEALAKGLNRDDYALAPDATEPPVVGTARIQVDVAVVSSTAVPVPLEAFDRLVRVAMWVSRGQSMAHVPDPLIGTSYPDTAARAALGALDDAGLLDTYRQTAEESSDA